MLQLDKQARQKFCVGKIAGWSIVMLFAGAMLYLMQWRMQGDLPVDSYEYMAFSNCVLHHGWETALREFPRVSTFPLLLCWLMSKMAQCGLSLESAGRILNVIGCLGLAWGVWSCCQVLYRDKLLAVCAALLTISLPGFFRYSYGILRDPLFWCLLIWQIRMLLTWAYPVRFRWRKPLIFGILSGLGLLTRKEQFFLLPLELVLIAVLEWRFAARCELKKRVLHVMAFCALLGVLAASLLGLMYWDTGTNFTHTRKGLFQSEDAR